VQLHYVISNASRQHFLFVMTSKMRNNAGSYKGRVRLY
jgi:hypothetical protein